MRRFLLKLLLFLGPIVLALGLVECGLSRLQTGYATKRGLLERNIGGARVLVTGSSHAYYAVQPRLFGVPAFNTAYVSQDIYYDTRIVLRYLPRAPNLRLVVVSVSYFSFEAVTEDSMAAPRVPFYTRYWDIPPATPGRWAADYSYIALHGAERTRAHLWDFFRNSDAEHIDPEGGNAVLPVSNRNAVESGAVAVARHHSSMKVHNLPKTVRWMEEMLAALQARGVAVVLITTPVSRSYRERIDPAAYARMQEAVGGLCRKYGLEYRNYLADSRFTPEDFADSDHLVARGAEKLSLILRDEVLSRYVE